MEFKVVTVELQYMQLARNCLHRAAVECLADRTGEPWPTQAASAGRADALVHRYQTDHRWQ